MTDPDIHRHITDLVAEEHELRSRQGDGEGTAADHDRIAALEVELDRLWDLLRRRDARRTAELPPGDDAERPAAEVEGYLQ